MSALSTVAMLRFVATSSPSIAAASPAANRDRDLLAAADELIQEDRGLASIEKRRASAERIVKRWDARNPKPVIRECKVGSSAEYERWFKLWAEAEDHEREALDAIDPNADLKLSMREHEAGVRIWRGRKQIAEQQAGLLQLNDFTFESKEKIEGLMAEFRAMRPTTFEGVAAKARVARTLHRHEEGWSKDIAIMLVNYEIGILSGDLDFEDDLLSAAS